MNNYYNHRTSLIFKPHNSDGYYAEFSFEFFIDFSANRNFDGLEKFISRHQNQFSSCRREKSDFSSGQFVISPREKFATLRGLKNTLDDIKEFLTSAFRLVHFEPQIRETMIEIITSELAFKMLDQILVGIDVSNVTFFRTVPVVVQTGLSAPQFWGCDPSTHQLERFFQNRVLNFSQLLQLHHSIGNALVTCSEHVPVEMTEEFLKS